MTDKKPKYIEGVGWRYETEHNQKRRLMGHRYNDVGTYLVTIVVKGATPSSELLPAISRRCQPTPTTLPLCSLH